MSLSKAKKAANTVAILMVANFIVKFFGLFREILIARYYGTSELTDAYTIAHNIPMILFSMVAHVIATRRVVYKASSIFVCTWIYW